MDALYPAGPAAGPADLTLPSASYRRHAWFATAGLVAFVVLYFALAGWFCWTAWRLLSGAFEARGDGMLIAIGVGVCAAFLAVFMLKAVFFIDHGAGEEDVELTPAEQPRLFEFLYRLADEAGAPRPHRVFASGRVNAAVFYDLSIANLFFASRKNLEIGLALVNVLPLGELKAVLAHEFGHFAQRTMAVGRWVYIGQQIAGHIVARRDALDTLLIKLSGIDLRVAWIGWLLRLVVWSIRSLVELLFRGVVIAQRALSREMEFQADLVAVSLTGSDALIHALHRLNAADEAWQRTLDFANTEFGKQRAVRDLFAIQSRVIERMRGVLDDPEYGAVPSMPATRPEVHRVFRAELAAPPRMWSTHPANADREENAKKTYVPAAIDERSAWELFDGAATLRERVSEHMVRGAEFKPVPIEDSLQALDQQFDKAYLNRAYRGAYMGRSCVRRAQRIEELYSTPPPPDALARQLGALYPESLAQEVERLRELEEERGTLEALRAGLLTAAGGTIRHRGEEITRKQLPDVIEGVQAEIDRADQSLRDHDRRCRTAHLAAAKALGGDWEAYLRGLLALLHYADHSEANLLDARGLLTNTLNVVMADGKVSSKELKRLVGVANDVYQVLAALHAHAPQVLPDRTVLRRLGIEAWAASLGEFTLPAADDGNIGDWLNAIDGWVGAMANALSALRLASLEQLLAAETQVTRFYTEKMKPAAAPPASAVPGQYALLLPGNERKRQTKLGWWDRFQTADGVVPAAARIAVAASLLGAVLFFGAGVGTSTVSVYNGLGRPVVVTFGEQSLPLAPFRHQSIEVPQDAHYQVVTKTATGTEIERFEVDTKGQFSHYVYSVAGAAPLVAWTATYGNAQASPPKSLGNLRWTNTTADFVFDEPPTSVSTKNGGATRTALSALAEEHPSRVLEVVDDDAARAAIVQIRARWDSAQSPYVRSWLDRAAGQPGFEDLLAARLRDEPRDVLNGRIEQDSGSSAQRATVCQRHAENARARVNDSAAQYLAARCIDDQVERGRRMRELATRFKRDPWIDMSVAYADAGDARWAEAQRGFEVASRKLPSQRDLLDVDIARLLRLTSDRNASRIRKLQDESVYLDMLVRLESGEEVPEGPLRSYSLMDGGKLAEANAEADRASADEELAIAARVQRLAAASDGATDQMVFAALVLPFDKGLDSDTVWTMLALAARMQQDLAPYTALIEQHGARDARYLQPVFEALRSGADPTQIEATLAGGSPQQRGMAYSMGLILRGTQAPQAWRDAARTLLFASERPYFTP